MRPLHLIVVGRNVAPWAAVNMVGITSQVCAGPWRCTWIDDDSTDDTGRIARAFAEMRPELEIKVVTNPQRRGGIFNLWDTIRACPDDEVIVHWDADDFFEGCNVLATIADAYSDPSVWMTYGSYKRWPTLENGIKGPYPEDAIALNAFRAAMWVCEPPRSFLAGLFKHLDASDLQTAPTRDSAGHWIDCAWDFAMYLPLLEMAGRHAKYISTPLYLYNESNPLSDWCTRAEEQYRQGEETRRRPPRAPLERIER